MKKCDQVAKLKVQVQWLLKQRETVAEYKMRTKAAENRAYQAEMISWLLVGLVVIILVFSLTNKLRIKIKREIDVETDTSPIVQEIIDHGKSIL